MDGILIVNKPEGISSYGVIRRLKWIFDTKKIGHGGTLDPFASGVLVIAVNDGTKIIQYSLDSDKGYVAKLKLGEMTDSYDRTGKVVKSSEPPVSVTEDEFVHALNRFSGEIDQIPPMFSAKKVNGVKLYNMAREGLEVERKSVKIRIDEIALIDYSYPYATIKVTCSKGTYIRSLANDIGIALGTYAHLVELHRTKSGQYSIDDACTLEELESAKEAGTLKDRLISLNDALPFIPSSVVSDDAEKNIRHGVRITDDDIVLSGDDPENTKMDVKPGILRLVSKAGRLLALAEC